MAIVQEVRWRRAASVPGVIWRWRSVAACRVGRVARIHHDQRTAAFFLFHEILHYGRHGFREVAADEENCFGSRDIRERKGKTAIDPERFYGRRSGGRHAESPVVIDLRGSQRDARKLAEEIGFFVGQPASAEDANAISAVRCLHAFNRSSDAVERFLPGCGTQRFGAVVSRTSGVRKRSGLFNSSAEVHPFWHNPPRLVGKSRSVTFHEPFSPDSRCMPHCREQYGQ